MVQIANPAGNFPVLNGQLPCEGTKALPFFLDFTQANAYQIDLTTQYNQKQFTTIQTVFVDNSQNADALEIICGTTSQNITVTPNTQGFYAMLLPTPPKFTVQTEGQLVVEIILLNFYIPPCSWSTLGGGNSVDVPALDAIINGGAMNVRAIPDTVSDLVDASGAIAAGGTGQVLFAAGAARKRWLLANPSTATEVLSFAIGAIGNGYIDLLPGATWDESGSTIVGQEIFVKAATTGHAFTAYND